MSEVLEHTHPLHYPITEIVSCSKRKCNVCVVISCDISFIYRAYITAYNYTYSKLKFRAGTAENLSLMDSDERKN